MIVLWACKCGENEWFSMKGRTHCNGAYLDGKLEEMNGYDLFCLDENVYETLKDKQKGTESVLVNLSNGKVVSATFYFWTYVMENVTVVDGFGENASYEFRKEYPRFRGLVVLDDDRERVRHAKARQEENAEFL